MGKDGAGGTSGGDCCDRTITRTVIPDEKRQLVMSSIWTSVMEGTAWCGWKDKHREGLVKAVQDSVSWAMGSESDAHLERWEKGFRGEIIKRLQDMRDLQGGAITNEVDQKIADLIDELRGKQ